MKATLILCGLALPLCYTGCTQIRQTLKVEGQVFVKIPRISTKFEKKQATIIPTTGSLAKIPGQEETWTFKPVVQGPDYKQYKGEWYMAYTEDRKRSVVSRGLFTKRGYKRVEAMAADVARATHQAFGIWPTVIEPNDVFRGGKVKSGIRNLEEPEKLGQLGLPSSAWATHKEDGLHVPGWHLKDEYSQLEKARDRVRKKTGSAGGGIKVAIMDTGYDGRLVHGKPRGLQHLGGEGDAYQQLLCLTDCEPKHDPGDYMEGHGTRTMSVLAGGHVDIPCTSRSKAFHGDLGGVPDATILPYRVAPWVVSPTTANLAWAIDNASRKHKADVISMSHGGAPSMMWMDAVNAAMDRGTAIVAATGDYVMLPGITAGIGAPSATVYPASCRRVLAVGGVTASGHPYGKTDWSKNFLSFSAWTRGSYGPDRSRWMWSRKARMAPKNYDNNIASRLGVLHAFPVNGYAPNVTALSPAAKNGKGGGKAKLSFSGASASTPQVAAAAALWMAHYKKDLEKDGLWHSWQKPQMAYMALIKAAERQNGDEPHLFLGSGSLKASDALNFSPDDIRRFNTKALKWPGGNNPEPPHDIYDGAHGLMRVLKLNAPFLDDDTRTNYEDRMPLQPIKGMPPPADLRGSLNIIHQNLQLSYYWRKGRIVILNSSAPKRNPVKHFFQHLFGYGRIEAEKVRRKASALSR